MKKLFVFLFLASCTALTWLAWNPPLAPYQPSRIHMELPGTQALEAGSWRVITRRMVWQKSVNSMQARLAEAGLNAKVIQKREPIALHAFDDPRTFAKESDAGKIKAEWRKRGIEADVFKYVDDNDQGMFKVGLGRFYMSEYAEAMQNDLKKTQQPYQYERRMVSIPSYHFVFPAMSKNEAEIIWKRLQNIGIADPIIIQQSEFKKLYPNSFAKRSNK